MDSRWHIRSSNLAGRVAHHRLWHDSKALKKLYQSNLNSRTDGLAVFGLVDVLSMAELV